MTRSRRRKLVREKGREQSRALRSIVRSALPLAALAAVVPAVGAQSAGGGLQTIVITAQKIKQNLHSYH